MATQIPVGGVKHFRSVWRDAAGNVATVDTRTSPGLVTVSDPALGAIENLSADGLEGDLRVLALGTGQVSITVDADLGDGVRALIALGDFEGVPGEAVVGTVEFSG